MSFPDDRLEAIFDKTDGDCTYCEKQLAWSNYGQPGYRSAWEVDHSVPMSRGGTDHLNNLVPACLDCNREKSDMTGQEFRNAMASRNVVAEGPDWGEVALFGLLALAGGALLGGAAGLRRGPPGPGPGW